MNISPPTSSPLITTTTISLSSSSGSGAAAAALSGAISGSQSIVGNSLSETKIKIEQSVPSGAMKKSPHKIVRSAELNDAIQIKRRFGEGTKPIFSREDITVNQEASDESCSINKAHDNEQSDCRTSQRNRTPSTNSDSSSPERYRHRTQQESTRKNSTPSKSISLDNKNKETNISSHHYHRNARTSSTSNFSPYKSDTKSRRYSKTNRRRSRSVTPPSTSTLKQRISAAEKVPYFRDRVREKDRLTRLYGYDKNQRSRSRSPEIKNARRRRSLTPTKNSRQRHRSSSFEHKYRDRDHSNQYRNNNRNYSGANSNGGSARHSSPSRSRHDRSNHHRDCTKNDNRTNPNAISTAMAPAPIAAAPQPIIIPVAVPTPTADYAYGYTTWPAAAPPGSWAAASQAAGLRPHTHPHFTSFHHPLMPLIPTTLRPTIPPMHPQMTYGPPMAPYNPMGMRPPRYMQQHHHNHYNHHHHHRFNAARHPSGHNYQPRIRKPHN